jgi:hypothetical protein
MGATIKSYGLRRNSSLCASRQHGAHDGESEPNGLCRPRSRAFAWYPVRLLRRQAPLLRRTYHFEIGRKANVYDGEALLVRGRDPPYGCAIRIATIDRSEDARAKGSRTRTPPRCSVIMRVQNIMQNVTDPAFVTLVEIQS